MSNAQAIPASALLQQAAALHRAGRLEDAQDTYRALLRAEPDHAQAHHNLGVLMVQSGRAPDALAHLARALERNPAEALFYFSYAKGLLAAGDPAQAGAVLRQAEQFGLTDKRFEPLKAEIGGAAVRLYQDALAADPRNPVLLDNLGSALLAQGRTEEAIAAYEQALARDPDFAEAHYHLGVVLSDRGRIREGFAHYMQRAALVHGRGKPPEISEPPHKRAHDRAQRDYLYGGQAPADAPEFWQIYRIAQGARLPGAAVNPAPDMPALLEAWRTSRPQAVVLDDFLTPAALQQLRLYCAGSTVWRKIYPAGYLGAAPEDGFACPLLAQIVEEIQAVYRPILGEERFRYLGAFKYDSDNCGGTNVHADNSILNVNFYITPDEANLDPDHGGMEIWDLAATSIEMMRKLNGNEEMALAHLRQSAKASTIIPHRANRAVIFKSTQFHRTDTFRFKSGYLDRRINISLLFGQFA